MGLLAPVTTACTNKKESSSQSDKVSIVATTNVYADITRNVVGEYGTAMVIIDKSSTGPHDFGPTTTDAKKLTKANIIVANGLRYDSWMSKLAKSVNKKPVLIDEDLVGLKDGDSSHIWYNLNMPTKYVNHLVKRLSKLNKKHAAYFRANGEKYLAKVDKIKKLARADKDNKKPIFASEPVSDCTLREAGYKVDDKELEEAIENDTDPGPKMINKMNTDIEEKKIAFLVNNTRASSSTIKSFVRLAKKSDVSALNIRETVPSHTTYLIWVKENYQNLANIENK